MKEKNESDTLANPITSLEKHNNSVVFHGAKIK